MGFDLTVEALAGDPEEQRRLISALNERRRERGPQHLYMASTGGHHGASKAEFMEATDNKPGTTALLDASAAARRAAEAKVNKR